MDSRTKKPESVVSAVLPDGQILEQIYSPKERVCRFATLSGGSISLVERYRNAAGSMYVPYSAANNLIKNQVVLLPEKPVAFGSEGELLSELRSCIHRYVDIGEVFESIAVHYILLSWLYDRFQELPYLRLRGDFGSGKSRFLRTIGSLCYRPIFASGASTVAPLFHILDSMGGTLLVDEADFRFSDERADIVKILNQGNSVGFPVLRCAKLKSGEFQARSFQVFGPKIVASRNDFDDLALESRFLTEDMGRRPVRSDIPVSLPRTFGKEAAALRNKLLMFRLKNLGRYHAREDRADASLDRRENQVLLPLLSVMSEAERRHEVLAWAKAKREQHRTDRSTQVEAEVLGAIQTIRQRSPRTGIAIAEIARELSNQDGSGYDRRISPKWVGYIVRKRLHLETRKSRGVYIVSEQPEESWKVLFERFGIDQKADTSES